MSRGFSLIEVMVVVALAAIATGLLAVTVGGAMQGRQLRAAAEQVASQLKFTRAQALVSGRSQVFTLDVESRDWSAAERRRGRLPGAVSVEMFTARQETDGGTAASIRFFPDGSATGGGVSVRRGRAEWQVSVDWLTGRVRMRRGEGS